jgi:hypothetical protein
MTGVEWIGGLLLAYVVGSLGGAAVLLAAAGYLRRTDRRA